MEIEILIKPIALVMCKVNTPILLLHHLIHKTVAMKRPTSKREITIPKELTRSCTSWVNVRVLDVVFGFMAYLGISTFRKDR